MLNLLECFLVAFSNIIDPFCGPVGYDVKRLLQSVSIWILMANRPKLRLDRAAAWGLQVALGADEFSMLAKIQTEPVTKKEPN